MDRVQRSVQYDGIPLAVYADTQTTDQSPAPPTVDEPLAGGSVGGRWVSWESS